HAQAFKPVEFSEFEKFLQTNNDTLYVVNFWATWCKPCIEELPSFEKLDETAAEQKIKVILVSVDTESRWESSLEPFIEKRNLQPEVWSLYNTKPVDWIDKISPEWNGTIPATLFLRNGTKTFLEKEFTSEELHTIVEQLKL
ncbi:MAG: TlpA disulfide reductase family protein, partial [Chitinophagales bacterium]